MRPVPDGSSSDVTQTGPWRSYKERVAQLSARLVEAQRPIRILNAIKWGPDVFERFRDSKWREQPRINKSFYDAVELGFDGAAKIQELQDLAGDVEKQLGRDDGIGAILLATCQEYVTVVRMLEARGTKEFFQLSSEIYGKPTDLLSDNTTRILDLSLGFYEVLTKLDDDALGKTPVRDIPATSAVEILNERLNRFFPDDPVRVMLDDGIAADAAAGSDYVKIREGAVFSHRDIGILEVHEGWVHVATSMNGQKQPVARWLSKGPPRTAATQEGLAAIMEILTLRTYPRRARRLNDRVLAVAKAADGACFMDVFEWFRTEGYDEETCFWNAQRVFRGGVIDGGAPFTKDIVYTRGIIANFNFLRSAIQASRPELIPWLFVGKVALEDIPILAARAHEGVVRPPHYLPDIFKDLNGLAIWLGVSSLWDRLNNTAIQRYYERLFARG